MCSAIGRLCCTIEGAPPSTPPHRRTTGRAEPAAPPREFASAGLMEQRLTCGRAHRAAVAEEVILFHRGRRLHHHRRPQLPLWWLHQSSHDGPSGEPAPMCVRRECAAPRRGGKGKGQCRKSSEHASASQPAPTAHPRCPIAPPSCPEPAAATSAVAAASLTRRAFTSLLGSGSSCAPFQPLHLSLPPA